MVCLEVWAKGENLAERGVLFTVGDPQANTEKNTWEVIVNPDVDGYTETPNQWKILWKCKITNLLKTKKILKLEKSKQGPGFYI